MRNPFEASIIPRRVYFCAEIVDRRHRVVALCRDKPPDRMDRAIGVDGEKVVARSGISRDAATCAIREVRLTKWMAGQRASVAGRLPDSRYPRSVLVHS